MPQDKKEVESNLSNDFDKHQNPSVDIPHPKVPIVSERGDKEFALDQSIDKNEIDWGDLKKKELLKRNLINVEKKQRSNAIKEHGRPKIGAWNVPNVGKDDPLIQLQYKKEDMDFVAKLRLAHDKNLSQKSRDRIKDSLAAELNQRRLLNEGNRLEDKREKYYESNNELLNRLNGPGMRLIREKFGLAMDDEPKPQRGQIEMVQKVPLTSAPFRTRIAALGDFDMEAYLSAQRMKEGEGDPMKNFQFNQVASDSTPPDRYIKDFRSPR